MTFYREYGCLKSLFPFYTRRQTLAGRPAGLFFSTSTQNGGQETTALSTLKQPFVICENSVFDSLMYRLAISAALTQLTHHGMVYVPVGYTTPHMVNMNEIKGGSPYGAGTIAGGDGSRQVSEVEMAIAKHQGNLFAQFVKDLYKGRPLPSSK